MINSRYKEKMLLISGISPFPLDSGGAVRIYNTIRELSERFDLVFVFFIPFGYKLQLKEKKFLNIYTKQYIPIHTNPFKSELVFLNDYQPYWFTDWYSDEIKLIIHNLLQNNSFSLIQIEFTQLLYISNYIPKEIKKIFIAHDISSISFKRRLNEISDLKTKLVHFWRWWQVKKYEEKYLPSFDLVVTMSDKDANQLIKEFQIKNIYIEQNGIDMLHKLKKTRSAIIRLGYIGSFNHPPNKFAVQYFLNHIAPLLEERKINYQYFIAGNNIRDEILYYINKAPIKDKKRVVILGHIEKLIDFYKQIDVLLATLQSGSGTRIKILEALSYKTTVISTIIGGEGLEELQSKNFIICRDNYEIVDALLEAKKNNFNYQNSKILTPYLWRNIFKKYSSYLKKHGFT